MFLWTCNIGASNRQVQERFAHSGETISRCFHEVLEALLLLQDMVIKLLTIETPLGDQISKDTKYATYFADCIGALNGTYINIHVPVEDRPRYRDRNGLLSQNVLAACDFNIEFCYILAG
jgi:adenosyl cobinamide kinase/adenosyl cobinamide phosphate guanylyltransferase